MTSIAVTMRLFVSTLCQAGQVVYLGVRTA